MKTDERVTQDVVTELNWELPPDAGKICVAVKGGVVTLTGHVSSYAEKWDAERAAQRVPTDKVVATAAATDSPEPEPPSGPEIAHRAQSMLQTLTYLPMGYVHVVVEQRGITLSDEVVRTDPSPAAPVEAVDPTQQVDAPGCDSSGPRTVVNRITVE